MGVDVAAARANYESGSSRVGHRRQRPRISSKSGWNEGGSPVDPGEHHPSPGHGWVLAVDPAPQASPSRPDLAPRSEEPTPSPKARDWESIAELRDASARWLYVSSDIRPHEVLGWMMPAEKRSENPGAEFNQAAQGRSQGRTYSLTSINRRGGPCSPCTPSDFHGCATVEM